VYFLSYESPLIGTCRHERISFVAVSLGGPFRFDLRCTVLNVDRLDRSQKLPRRRPERRSDAPQPDSAIVTYENIRGFALQSLRQPLRYHP